MEIDSTTVSWIGVIVSLTALFISLIVWHMDHKDKEAQGELLRRISSGVDKYDFILRQMMLPLLELARAGMTRPPDVSWEKEKERLAQVIKFGLIVKRVHKWGSEKPFVAVGWVKNTKLQDEPEALGLFQQAIDQGLLLTHQRPNPRKPQYPTTCCTVNMNHPTVKEILNSK